MRNPWRISSGLAFRLVIGGGVLLALVIVAFALMLNAISRLDSANEAAATASDELVLSSQLRGVALDSVTAVRGYLISGQNSFLGPPESAEEELPALEHQARAAASGESGASARELLQIVAQARSAIEGANRLLEEARGDLAAGREQVTAGAGERRLDRLRDSVATYQEGIAEAEQEARADAHDSAHRATALGVIGATAAALLIILLTALAAIQVIFPLRRFAVATRRVGAGDLDVDVPQGGPGEVGILAESMNQMTATLRRNRADLEQTLTDLGEERDQAERHRRFIDRLAAEQGQLQPLATTMLEELCLTSGSECASLYVIDERGETDHFWLAATVGMPGGVLPALLEPDEGAVGRAARSHSTIVLSREEATLEGATLSGTSRVADELHLPLEQAGRVLGVVSLGRSTGGRFEATEIDPLETEASSAAVALSNALSLRSAADAAQLNQAVLDTAHDAYIAIDEDGTVQSWNPEASVIFGYAETEAVGSPITDLIILPENRESHHTRRETIITEAIDGGHLEPYEVWMQDSAGRRRLVEVSASTVRRGPDWLINFFCRDVTERSLREKQLRAEEMVSRTLAEADGRADLIEPIIVALGESLEWPLGCFWEYDEKSGELRASRLWNGAGEAGGQLARETREAVVRLEAPQPDQAVTWRAWQTGDPQWGLVTDSPVRSGRIEGAEAAGVTGVVDIPVRGSAGALGVLEFGFTSNEPPDRSLLRGLQSIGDLIGQVIERRRAEEEADRLKNEFFALVSHELRTPLTSVIGYLDIVREDDEGGLNEDQNHYLEIIDRNARRLLRLVGDLLFVAQVEAGTLSLEKGEVDLRQVVLDAVEAAQPRAEKAEVTLGAEATPLMLEQGDHDRIGQLLDNLISNALKFTPAGGSVDVSLRQVGRSAVIDVTYTGIGISSEDQEHLFERFFRTERATERAIPGIGLGLSICAAIVQGSGGEISIHSAEGAGTTFRVELPLAGPSEAAAHDDALAGPVG
jgi:PAS domain S-box-containing protein